MGLPEGRTLWYDRSPNLIDRRTRMARDIILNLAVSLDGFICDEDGGFA